MFSYIKTWLVCIPFLHWDRQRHLSTCYDSDTPFQLLKCLRLFFIHALSRFGSRGTFQFDLYSTSRLVINPFLQYIFMRSARSKLSKDSFLYSGHYIWLHWLHYTASLRSHAFIQFMHLNLSNHTSQTSDFHIINLN